MHKTTFILLLCLGVHFLNAQYGALDPTFGDGGMVRTRYEPGYVTAYDVAIQPDSKILVTGQIYDSVSHLAVFRHLPDGNLDVAFGDSGIAILPQSANGSFGYRLKLQPDGKIVVAGPANLGGYWDIAVARFLPTGKPDLAFGNGGIATLDISGQQDHLLGMALQPDGKVLVVGMTTKTNTAFTLGMFVARFRSDGTLDNTFADNGVFTRSNPSFFDAANSVCVLADGNILIGGSHWLTTMSGSDYMFQCLSADGLPNPAFGDDGLLIYDFVFVESVYSMAVQPDGKVLAGGDSGDKLSLLRLDPDGGLEAVFGEEGRVELGFNNFICDGGTVALQPDGKILMTSLVNVGMADDFGLLRLRPNGTTDATFGDEGWLTTTFGAGYYDWAYSVAIQPDHKIVMAGYSTNGPDTHISLARYLSNYEPPPAEIDTLEALIQLYPNPTEGDATLEFWLGKETAVALDLYDAQGRLVQNLWRPETRAAGAYAEPLAIGDFVAAGTYFLVFERNGELRYLSVVKL